MLISNADLDVLEIEMRKLLDTGVFSNELGSVCKLFVDRILYSPSYIRYPNEWKELTAMDCYIKLIKTLPKYDNAKAQSSRLKHKKEESYKMGLYRYVQLICNSAANTSITKFIKIQNREKEYMSDYYVSFDALSNKGEEWD